MFLVSLERSRGGGGGGERGGAWAFGSMMFGLAVQKFLNIEWFSSLRIKKIQLKSCKAGKFQRKVECDFWSSLGRSRWAGFNGIF